MEDFLKGPVTVTIKDIGKLVGMSHSTVSRALNDSPLVSLETREKIKRVARSVNFEFDAAGRSLSNRKTGVIGVIYNSHLERFGSSLYTNQLFVDLRHQLESFQLDSILLEAYNPGTGNSNISRLVRQNKVDAFLIAHTRISREDYRLMLQSAKPVVQLHKKALYHQMDELDYFLTDNVAGATMACDHLLDSGCRNILTITSKCRDETNPEFADRVEGTRRSFENHGLAFDPASLVDVGDCSFEAGYQLVHERPELFERVDGVFAQADIIAFGCVSALKERGFSIPDEIKVIGFDDCSVCTMIRPTISSVHQPREELSRLACQRIHQLLSGEASAARVQSVLTPGLVVRESTRHPRVERDEVMVGSEIPGVSG